MRKLYTSFLLACLCMLHISSVQAQCMYYPVPLAERADKAAGIVLGKMTGAHSYWDAKHENIYTLYRFQVDAWLKGNTGASEVGIIAIGGFVGNEGQTTYPTVSLADYNEYIIFLEGDNHELDDRALRLSEPSLMQTFTYADQQGALTKQFGIYHDHMRLFEPCTEEVVFGMLENLTGEAATTPSGTPFPPRPYTPPGENRSLPITSFAPNPTNAGTIVIGDFITITGSGFGAAAGTVFYANADDGGATFTASGVATDNTAWSDVTITNKPAAAAGTGPINVNGAMTSGSNLTVNYAHGAINSNFSGFGSTTRQRYYHRNMNGAGGMYFLYNTTSGMSGNAAAVAAFERALETWRCTTFINWYSNGTTATGFASDGTNIVIFDGTLPAGVLGRATSRFSGSASGGCTLANTVWCVNEIDVQMRTDPPVVGFPWEYGPAAPAFSEYDYESVALHELGHGHGLLHRIAAGQTMNFAISNGASARTPNANEITGGAVRMAYSSVATCLNPGACGSGPMTLLTSGTCSLPVLFGTFTGRYEPGKGNVLSWTSLLEENLLGYFVERSSEGKDFISIGWVEPDLTQTGEKQYHFTDTDAAVPQKVWYRIRQVDFDGNVGYSEVIEVQRPLSETASVVFNSASGEIVINGLHSGFLALYDMQGRKLREFVTSSGVQSLPISGLASGAYLWRFSSPSSQASGKIAIWQ